MRQRTEVSPVTNTLSGRGRRAVMAGLGGALARWVALALPLHLAWEWAQAPLYALWREGSRTAIAYSVLHCTAGDALIAGASYLVGAACTRAADWPNSAVFRGTAAALLSGVAYTAWSEWVNVYRWASWAYTDSMPRVAGIGLAPLLQWLLLTPATVLLWRRLRGRIRTPPTNPRHVHPRR